jgi:hypothetical protein
MDNKSMKKNAADTCGARNVVSAEPKYGLPIDVKFCVSCVISNQRPNSAIETSHTSDSKKDTLARTRKRIN